MPLHISKSATAETRYEYGCDLRRVYPWSDVVDPMYWGAAIASVRVNEATTPHSHDEDETFFIMSGTGRITVDDEHASVTAGDVIFLPRGSTHTIANENAVEQLVFLTVYWGSPEAKGAMRRALDAEARGELIDA